MLFAPYDFLLFGTPSPSRTERALPFERSDFTNLSNGAFGVLDGERSHTIAFTEQCADHYTTNTINLVRRAGIEPTFAR
jgi:hypothetical protein